MAKVVVRSPTRADQATLAGALRQADRDEVAAACSDSLEEVIRCSVRDSEMCWAVDIDDQLVCIFGCAVSGSLLARTASPWLLGTDHLDRHPVTLMKTCRPYIVLMRKAFPHLLNFVDARNLKSVRWLRRLGFTINSPEPYGPHGLPFHRFEMRSPHV